MNINEWFETVGAFIAVITPFLLGVIAIWNKQRKNGGTTHHKVTKTLEAVEKLAKDLKNLNDKKKQKKKGK